MTQTPSHMRCQEYDIMASPAGHAPRHNKLIYSFRIFLNSFISLVSFLNKRCTRRDQPVAHLLRS